MGDGCRNYKAENMFAQTLHWNRARKPAHYNSVKQKLKTDLGGKKKRNKRRIYGLLLNAWDFSHWTGKTVLVEIEKGRQERRGDWGFDEVMFAFLFARTSFSGLYRWRTSIRTKFFSLNAGAIDRELWSTLKISICYSVSVMHISM